MPKSRLVRIVLALAAVSLCVAAAALGCRPSRPSQRVELGVAALRISLPVFVAAERGLFARRGLDVRLRSYVTAQPMLDDAALGRLDAAGFVAYPIAALASTRSGRALHAATSLLEDDAHRLSYVLARRGSTLRFPADARGKRVGILPTVAYRRWLAAMLRAAGVDAAEVTVVPIDPPMQSGALRDGAVDLMFTNDPMATAMIRAGVAEVVDDGPPCARRLGAPFAFGTFVLGDALVRERPAVARALVDAIDEAIDLARADEPAARAAMARHLRPEERASVERYPSSRYLRSTETAADFVAAEIARERALGILEAPAPLRAWSPRP